MRREVAEILADATRHGWRVDRTKKNHWRLRGPNGGLVYMSGTPSDWRSIKNLEAQIRRAERAAAVH